ISVQDYYSYANYAFEKQQWSDVVDYCRVIIQKYPQSIFTKDALFYLGVSYFNLKEYELSNRYFTRYLKDDFNPKYFEESMHYKFSIAEKFKEGSKKRLFGKGPKLIVADDDALAIYDEIISSMPLHELAIKSLFSKGQILLETEEYKDSVLTFEQIVSKFPKHELAIESFIQIGKVYLKQTNYKKQDLDNLELAELNLKNLKDAQPQETEKIKELETILLQMKEIFANGFLEIADFYKRTNKKEAAIIYYSKILNAFPQTQVAVLAKEKIDQLNAK
ncbi:MAG: tetratricopeptide repeat protein, partial [Parachlamydiales bacterium]